MKIVIIVLILIALLFVVFVIRGGLRNDDAPSFFEKAVPGSGPQMKKEAKNVNGEWAKPIQNLFNRFNPKLELQKKCYSGSAPIEEKIKADKDKAFRTATFHLITGSAEIEYDDSTQIESDNPLSEMDDPQECELPQDDPDVKDKRSCSIVAMKGGGTLKFECTNNSACRVEVVKDGCK